VGQIFETKAEAMPGEGPASMILKTSIKYWPAEYHSQSAIEAALHIRNQIQDLSQVKTMVIESHDASVDIIGSEPEKWRPQSRETADHSLPYITAVALIDGEITDKQFDPKRFTQTEIVSFLQNVEVKRNDELSAIYAEAVANIVHVKLADGRTLTKRVDYPLGNAKNRLPDDGVEGKFLQLAAPKIGKDAADKVIEHCWKFDDASNASDLMKSLVMPS
jgi:2-methylcitrate dehydratase